MPVVTVSTEVVVEATTGILVLKKPVEVGKEYEVDVVKSVDKEMGLLGSKDLLYLSRMQKLDRKLRSGLLK